MSAGAIRTARGLFRGIVLGRSVGRWMRLCPRKETATARERVGGHGVVTDGHRFGYGHGGRCMAYEGPQGFDLARAIDARRGHL